MSDRARTQKPDSESESKAIDDPVPQRRGRRRNRDLYFSTILHVRPPREVPPRAPRCNASITNCCFDPCMHTNSVCCKQSPPRDAGLSLQRAGDLLDGTECPCGYNSTSTVTMRRRSLDLSRLRSVVARECYLEAGLAGSNGQWHPLAKESRPKA